MRGEVALDFEGDERGDVAGEFGRLRTDGCPILRQALGDAGGEGWVCCKAEDQRHAVCVLGVKIGVCYVVAEAGGLFVPEMGMDAFCEAGCADLVRVAQRREVLPSCSLCACGEGVVQNHVGSGVVPALCYASPVSSAGHIEESKWLQDFGESVIYGFLVSRPVGVEESCMYYM
jgi:hypothetical protein